MRTKFLLLQPEGNPPRVADKTIRLEFFAVSADNAGNMTFVPLTALTHETPFRDVYGAKLERAVARGRAGEGGARIVSLAVGDFDGDGTSEIAVFFKNVWRATGIKYPRGWPDGPKVGDIRCRVHKWNAQKGAFDTAETVKDYHGEKKYHHNFLLWELYDYSLATGVVGLRAVTADLNGDGRDEIATVILGYFHRRA